MHVTNFLQGKLMSVNEWKSDGKIRACRNPDLSHRRVEIPYCAQSRNPLLRSEIHPFAEEGPKAKASPIAKPKGDLPSRPTPTRSSARATRRRDPTD